MINVYLYRELSQNNQNNQKIEKIKIDLLEEKNKTDKLIKELQDTSQKIGLTLQELNALSSVRSQHTFFKYRFTRSSP
jgi:hypothetical protein